MNISETTRAAMEEAETSDQFATSQSLTYWRARF